MNGTSSMTPTLSTSSAATWSCQTGRGTRGGTKAQSPSPLFLLNRATP